MLVTGYIFTDFDRELLKRDDNGCVVCPSSAGSCPSCPSGKQCQLSSPTCTSCSEYYCATIQSKKTTPVGGIVGGVIGGLAFIALIVGIVYYVLIFKKREVPYYDEKDDEEFWDEEDDSALDSQSPGMISSPSGSFLNTSHNNTSTLNLSSIAASPAVSGAGAASGPSPARSLGVAGAGVIAGTAGAAVGGVAGAGGAAVAGLRPPAQRKGSRPRRISSYESFTRTTKTQQQRQKQSRMQRQQRQIQILQQRQQQQQQLQQTNQMQPFNSLMQPSNRNSVATSFSNASNILPIAYIPGVTVVPNPSNTRLIFSSEMELLYTDSISIVSIDPEIQQSTTTTAIRAQARLVDVNVDRIEEEDSDFDSDSDVDSDIGRTSSPFA